MNTMTDNTPLVSIIIPIYNVELYLRECLNSILAQTYSNLEIILVDDGSPDGCPAICDAYTQLDSRIYVIHQDNCGLSAARNAGLNIATGEWIVFVDSDDVISPRIIETLIKTAQNALSFSAVGFSRFTDKCIPTESTGNVIYNTTKPWEFIAHRSGMFCWGALYSKALINHLNLRFDVSICNLEDVVWNAVYLSHIASMTFISDHMYYYRQNPTSVTSRCGDKIWQVDSWFRARASATNWFLQNGLSKAQIPYLRNFFRYCCNNIFAECTAGKLSFSSYNQLRKEYLLPYRDAKAIFGFEYTLESKFPLFYYLGYMALMWLHNQLNRKK